MSESVRTSIVALVEMLARKGLLTAAEIETVVTPLVTDHELQALKAEASKQRVRG